MFDTLLNCRADENKMESADSCVFNEVLQRYGIELENTVKHSEDCNTCSTFEFNHDQIKGINSFIHTNVSFGPTDRLLSECNISIEPPCLNMHNIVDNETTSSGIESFDCVEYEMSAALLDYDCDDTILNYSPSDLELDLSFLEEVMQGGEYAKCIPPLTLNRDRQKSVPLAQKVLPWERKKKKKGFTQKKLPARKCVSVYINKLNRTSDEEHKYSNSHAFVHTKSNSDFTEVKIYNSNKNDLESSRKHDSESQRRERPSLSKSSVSNKTHYQEEKSYKSSLRYLKMLQDSDVALKELNDMLCRTIESREEAFQMLSKVQSINKTLKVQLETATRSSRFNKKNKKNPYTFVLNYLMEQISKSEELTTFLDDAITETDRLTQFKTSN